MTLLFDLDGTLADPLAAFRASLYHAFDQFCLTRPSENQLRCAIGPPLHVSLSEIMNVPQSQVNYVLASYREHHAQESKNGYVLYPGALETLAHLRRSHRLFVATSKPHEQARPLLAHLGAHVHFQVIHGSEMDGVRSQKDELIAYILRENSLCPDETVMIGDRQYDIRGAKANGLRAIGVLWGYGSRTELEVAGADHLVREFSELHVLNFEKLK